MSGDGACRVILGKLGKDAERVAADGIMARWRKRWLKTASLFFCGIEIIPAPKKKAAPV